MSAQDQWQYISAVLEDLCKNRDHNMFSPNFFFKEIDDTYGPFQLTSNMNEPQGPLLASSWSCKSWSEPFLDESWKLTHLYWLIHEFIVNRRALFDTVSTMATTVFNCQPSAQKSSIWYDNSTSETCVRYILRCDKAARGEGSHRICNQERRL